MLRKGQFPVYSPQILLKESQFFICISDVGPPEKKQIWLILHIQDACKNGRIMFQDALYATISLEVLLLMYNSCICTSLCQSECCCSQHFLWSASFILIIVIFPNYPVRTQGRSPDGDVTCFLSNSITVPALA